MLKKLIYSLLFVVIAFGFVACGSSSEDEDFYIPDNEKEDNKEDDDTTDDDKQDEDKKEDDAKYDYYTETGLYLGITGFNSDLHHFSDSGFKLLNLTSCYSFKRFVSSCKRTTAPSSTMRWTMPSRN